MPRIGKRERQAKRANAQRALNNRAVIAVNLDNMKAIEDEYYYNNADKYRLPCGDRTTGFVGRVPGGMTFGGRPRAQTFKRWSVK